MSKENIDKWLDRIERVITLIKPRFHNAITKIVVIFGLALSVEHQVNIFEAMAVVIFESFFGSSEFLRSLFATSTNVWVGVVFVIFGLIYNAIVTVGLELVEKYKASIPTEPELKFSLINADGEVVTDSYQMRGAICFHNMSDIPENTAYSEYYSDKIRGEFVNVGVGQKVLMRPSSLFDPKVNKEFYRDRAKFLQIWGGAEIFYMKIVNSGSVIARNVRVELVIPKLPKLSASNENDLKPELPSQEHESILNKPRNVGGEIPIYDIKLADTSGEYFFEWGLGDVQAKESKTSTTDIFFRTESECQINVKVYCDEISKPIELTYTICATNRTYEVTLPLLMSKYKEFVDNIDELIMDGYMGRDRKKLMRECQSKEETLVPQAFNK